MAGRFSLSNRQPPPFCRVLGAGLAPSLLTTRASATGRTRPALAFPTDSYPPFPACPPSPFLLHSRSVVGHRVAVLARPGLASLSPASPIPPHRYLTVNPSVLPDGLARLSPQLQACTGLHVARQRPVWLRHTPILLLSCSHPQVRNHLDLPCHLCSHYPRAGPGAPLRTCFFRDFFPGRQRALQTMHA